MRGTIPLMNGKGLYCGPQAEESSAGYGESFGGQSKSLADVRYPLTPPKTGRSSHHPQHPRCIDAITPPSAEPAR
jgi:hypothetical protein